jgi:hypothetical protein
MIEENRCSEAVNMRRSQEPQNPWGLLCTFPGWRSLREALLDLEQLLRTIGGDAADLATTVAAVLEDPVSARADLPANYRLRLPLQKGRLPDHLDLESEVPGWVGDVARIACDVPALLEASGSADGLGPALTAELPRALHGRFADLVQRMRQMLQGRKLKSPLDLEPVTGAPAAGRGLRYAVPQADGFALVLPRSAGPSEQRAAGRELSLLLLQRYGLDIARLHLRLLAAWPGEIGREAVQAALGLRRPDPVRCYAAIRQLQGVRLSLYNWEVEPGSLTLEHQAQDLWALRLREGGQAHLVEEGNSLVTRGFDWWIAPGPHSWVAALPPEAVDGDQARLLLGELEGARNPLSLALGLTLGTGRTAMTNQELLQLAGVARTEPRLWQKVRAAVRLQQAGGWEGDLSGWDRELGRRLRENPTAEDWERFLQITTTFHRHEETPPTESR